MSDILPENDFTYADYVHVCKCAEHLKNAYDSYVVAHTKLATEAEQLRKERDELAAFILEVDDSCRTLFGDEGYELAKKVTENG